MNLDEHVRQKKVDKVKAKKWYSLAEEQDFPEAIFKSAKLFKDEKTNPTLYREKLKKAALLGERSAAEALAINHYVDRDSCDKVEYYASIALGSISNASQHEYLSTILGTSHLQTSTDYFYRTKYYLDIGAKKNFDCLPSVPGFRSLVCHIYSNKMLQLGMYEYCGYAYEIPGFSFLPKMRYWANEAGSDNMVMGFVAGPDDHGTGGRHETHCAYCNIEAPRGTKFKQCVRCKAAWCKLLKSFCSHCLYNVRSHTVLYSLDCSKDCQVEAWKVGHKSDCKQRF